MSKTAGIVVIGNEVLSGKTQDTNSHFLCRELRRLGVEVRKISTIPDEVELIAEEVAQFSRSYDFVFTSGGVGPTHDDVTIDGVARGFGLPVVRHPDLEERMRRRLGADINEARLRMANVPEGAELLATEALFAPVVKIRNVFILPGIPKILQERFHAIEERFRDEPFFLKTVFVKQGEGVIAGLMHDLLARYPKLLLGSYPVLDVPEYKVKVTLESKDPDYLREALEAFIALLPEGAVHRVE
ncbi:MAG TPA: competence/damage-inducible protein A [candidate division Zixibacteria bacterium]|nr:competence/damage-inducible protein A [candidate division Zixibacteria bacterium]